MKIKNFTYTINMEIYCILFMLYNLLAFNYPFFAKIQEISQSTYFTIGTFFVLLALETACCLILFHKYTAKLWSYLFLIINSGCFYFIYNYNIAIDEEMLINAIKTDVNEVSDLLNIEWFLYILILGIFPAFLVSRLKFTPTKYFKHRFVALILMFVLAFCIMLPNARNVSQFVRNNKPVKHYLTPINYIGAMISAYKHASYKEQEFQIIANDAVFNKYWQNDKKNLLVLVIGETARSANFHLDGYKRDNTYPLTPYLPQIINFSDVKACGTSTAQSLPCLLSRDSRSEFSRSKSIYTENMLDIFKKVGYKVLWIDNNSGCQNMCERVDNIRYGKPGEFLDDIMLKNLDSQLSENNNNFLLVMHQIGSHGPAYYKRYSKEYEKFVPVCNTEKLNNCSQQEIINTYDNSVLYTSQNLANTIQKLKKYDSKYNTLLVYVSDHGESLGEHNIYLHSAPYAISPKEQIQVPFFIWAEDSSLDKLNLNKQCLLSKSNTSFSHDNIFHSFLGIGGISTKAYDANLDIFSSCKQ